jgi:hypothetical protein
VLDGVTGTFFELPTAASLCEAIERLEGMTLDSRMIRSRAEGFDTGIFRRRWLDLLARLGVDPSLYASGT